MCCVLFVVCGLLSFLYFGCLVAVVRCLLLVACRALFAACCLLFNVCRLCLVFGVVRCSLLVVGV